jgi:cytochrome c556
MMADPMRRLAHVASIIAAGALLMTWQQASGTEDKSETEGIIFERQQVMTQLGKDSDLLGDIVAGLEPADKLAETTHAIAQGAHDAIETFKPRVPGGRAKAEVWSNNQDFSERLERFAKSADGLAELGKSGNKTAVTALLASALPFKECHDTYREPKK